MNELISLYNNSLIYFPDIFFLLLFLLGIITVFFLIKVSIIAKEKAAMYIEKLKKNAKQIHIKIHINRKSRIKTGSSIKRIIKNILIIINLIFLYIEIKTDKIIKKIEKKILIDEK